MAGITKIGELTRYITLNKVVTSINTTGEKEKSEVEYAKVWAKADDVSGNETAEGKIIALNVRKYTIHYSEEILLQASELLIVDIDGTYNVHSAAEEGYKQFLVLKCSKRE